MKAFDSKNKEMCSAYDLIAKTNMSFFLTGRAGTGKTTFLKQVQKCVHKNFVVVAPTGVAAMQVGGQTIHSFFGLGIGVLGPKDIGMLNESKAILIRNIDTIIMDEVSMVRCDTLDAVDRTLRHYRQSSDPFGGVQMVFVGDLYQLPPVVKQEDSMVLRSIYDNNSFFFFNARCMDGKSFPKIEFRKIYRQKDPQFIALLDKFRTGSVSDEDLEMINRQVIKDQENNHDDEMRVILTSYRKDAGMINDNRLEGLSGKPFVYEAIYEGDTSKLKDVVDEKLILKEGAQVMFLRNDRFGKWSNGTMARVESLSQNGIFVSLENEIEPFFVAPETWESFEYEYDKDEKKLKKVVIGKVTQYPLRLAWAITIHKSQSLTFDHITIDFGRGAFTYGQAYVALSRAKSLSGLKLVNPIDYSSVKVSRDVQMFAASYNDPTVISQELAVGEALCSFERRNDYDGAASLLFSMCGDAARDGKTGYAYVLLKRAMSYVVDDSCLYGKAWEELPCQNKEGMLLNAAGLLYSGHTDESIRILTSFVSAWDTDFNGLYLLARALEDKEDWENVQPLYQQMLDVCESWRQYGIDSPSFRKFKYRLAILNERHFGNSGIGLLKELMAENPFYDKYHTDLRWILKKRLDKLKYKKDDKNPLTNQMLDPAVTDEEFLKSLQKERTGKTDAWANYRKYISKLSNK